MQFVPLWTSILRSSKVAQLDGDLFKLWILCLVVAQEHDYRSGSLPNVEDLSYTLHIERQTTVTLLSRLVRYGFLDEVDGTFIVHDWADWRFREDTTNAERQRRHRAKKKKEKRLVELQDKETNVDDKVKMGNSNVTSQSLRNNATTTTTTSTTTTEIQHPPTPLGEVRVNALSDDPEIDRLAKLAEECTANCSWALWVSQQAKFGHPAHAIEEAISVCMNKGDWSTELAGGVLKRLRRQGYPRPAQIESVNGVQPQTVRLRPKTENQIKHEAIEAHGLKLRAETIACWERGEVEWFDQEAYEEWKSKKERHA